MTEFDNDIELAYIDIFYDEAFILLAQLHVG